MRARLAAAPTTVAFAPPTGLAANRSLIGSLVFVGVAGLAYCAHLGSQARFADEADYLRLSQTSPTPARYALDGVNSTAFRPPGYPYLLAIVRQLTDSIFVLRSLNVIFLAVAVWATWWLARRIGGPGAAAAGRPDRRDLPDRLLHDGHALSPDHGHRAPALGPGGDRRAARQPPPLPAGGRCWCRVRPAHRDDPDASAVALLIGVIWLARRHQRVLLLAVVIGVAAIVPARLDGPQPGRDARGHPRVDEQRPQPAARQQRARRAPNGVNADISAYIDEGQARNLNEMDLRRVPAGEAVTWAKAHPARRHDPVRREDGELLRPLRSAGHRHAVVGRQQAVAAVTYLPLLACSWCAWPVGGGIVRARRSGC